MRVGVFSGDALGDVDALVERVLASPQMVGADLAHEVTTAQPYVVPAVGERRFTVAALDLGIKAATPRYLAAQGCEVHVLPATTSRAGPARRWAPTGCSCPTAPGDPATTDGPVAAAQAVLAADVPLFGICFGNQILGRALGLGTYKLRYGHRGVNQPVQERASGRVHVTSHNHGFAVEAPTDGSPVRDAVRPGRGQPRRPQRRRRGGAALPRRPGLQRAVPPRGRARPARRHRAVPAVRRT